ncbi:MAG TPA: efflux RND transporter periplasmic adaptor subunit [Deltaproteobacteria bacterium]|nr:efflux RND transporter periplasmic adaptor subunit [Deltaproteobacteria bacterium]
MKTLIKLTGSVVVLAMLGVVMAYLAGFFETKIPVDFRGVVPSTVDGQIIKVEVTTEPLIEKAAGTVRAKVETVISPLVTARISSISVRSGDQVKKGAVLVQLDSRELKARVDQAHQEMIAAKARYDQAEKEYKRFQNIYKAGGGAVSKSKLDQVESVYTAARAELTRARRQEDEAETALSHSTLKAPISGRVVERYAEPGDTAGQGVPLLRLYDPDSLRLEASVRESVASKLSKAQRLTTEIDAIDKRFTSVLDEIVPSADPGSRSFLVKVDLKDKSGLFPGMFGRLLIPIGQTKKIYVPIEAVTRVGQLDFVIVKSEKGPTRRYVRLGTAEDDRVQVVSGLSQGEEILVRRHK